MLGTLSPADCGCPAAQKRPREVRRAFSARDMCSELKATRQQPRSRQRPLGGSLNRGLGSLLGSLGSVLLSTLGLLGSLGLASSSLLGLLLLGSLGASGLLGGLALEGGLGGATELVGEALDASTGVNKLLLAGVERVALVAKLDTDLGDRGAGHEGVTAGAAAPCTPCTRDEFQVS